MDGVIFRDITKKLKQYNVKYVKTVVFNHEDLNKSLIVWPYKLEEFYNDLSDLGINEIYLYTNKNNKDSIFHYDKFTREMMIYAHIDSSNKRYSLKKIN